MMPTKWSNTLRPFCGYQAIRCPQNLHQVVKGATFWLVLSCNFNEILVFILQKLNQSFELQFLKFILIYVFETYS